MLEQELKKCFKSYKDFPTKGILFQDLLTVLGDPDLFERLLIKMNDCQMVQEADAIIAIDARGFFFGTGISFLSKKPLIAARKPGKLPGELLTKSYSLEYGVNSLTLQKESIKDHKKFCIVDDLLATGGTVAAVEQILIEQKKQVLGVNVVVELTDLKGREKLNSELYSQVKF